MGEPVTYLDFTYDQDRKWLEIASRFDSLADDEDARQSLLMFLLPNGDFTTKALDGMLVTSAASNGDALWAVGQYGEIWTFPRGRQAPIVGKLPDSGPRGLGPPGRIRLIDEVPYVCGYAGQVYTLAADRWVHLDDGIREAQAKVDSLDLEGVHGTGKDDLFVVGSKGTLAHWNGNAWVRQPLLTTSYLAGVRALSKTHVVAVGDSGVFVERKGGNWSVEQVAGFEDAIFSDIETYQGKLYIAAVGTLLVRAGADWRPVDTGLDEPPEFIRLTTGGGKLWAMGAKRIHSFDGSTWTAHVDPDND